ncbi:MAG TPA: hypothetical protein VG267_13400 [Terracidiphilus sp.]|nr:hypothetical protein [Terracidiphilus sp.]
MAFWRAHPIRFAALLGGITGLIITLVSEIRGVVYGNHSAVVPLLMAAPGGAHMGAVQTALILLIEIAANVLVWALLFALPVAIIVGVGRIFGSRRRD